MPLLSVSAARTARIVLLISHSICQLSGRTPRIGPLFCESRFYLCVAMAPYPARGWSAGSVSSVEFDRQSGGSAQCGQRFPWGRTGAAGVGHAPCHHRQGFGQLEAGEMGTEAVVHAGAECLDRWGAHAADVETVGVVADRGIPVGRPSVDDDYC